jgi:hypothetical protein
MSVIDTLEIADELSRDGVFSREQAERLARLSGRAATDALASKEDIASLRSDIAALRGELGAFKSEIASEFARSRRESDQKIAESRADLQRTIAETRATLEESIARARADLEHAILLNRREIEVRIHEVNKETMKWMTGMLLTHGVAVIGVTVALIRLL